MKSKNRSWRWLAAVVVLGLLVAACGGSSGDTTSTTAGGQTTTTSGDGGTTTTQVAANPGLEGCSTDPLNCNSGPRQDGGDVIYLINQTWDGWNLNRVEGNSVYTVQALEGMQVVIGQYMPDGNWVWNMDVLASEPTFENGVITYELKDGVVWSNADGSTTPVSLDDFILQWKFLSGKPEHCNQGETDDAGNPVEGSIGCFPASTARYEDVVDVTGDGNKVMFHFPEGYKYAEWHAFFGGLYYPAHIAREQGFDIDTPEGVAQASDWFNKNVPTWSGGPYIIENATLAERVVMVPNPNWYGSEKPTLDTVTKEMISDNQSWLPALANREINGGSPASFTPDHIQQLQGMNDVYWGLGSGGAVWEHVDVNLTTLSDPALRKAILTAIDRADARTRIFGDINPQYRNNPIFPMNDPNFYEDHVEKYGYGSGDVEAARQILADAGYTGYDGGAGALKDPDGSTVPAVRFGFLASNTNRARFAELTQSYLAEIGIQVELVAAENLGALLVSPDWDLVIFGWSGSPLFTSSANQFYNSASGSNFGHLSNEQVDELVQAVLEAETLEEAADLVNQAMAIVLGEEAYTLPLWDTMNLTFVGTELVNIRDNHFDSTRAYYNLAQWGLAAAN